jgi:hypothetical protein
MAHDLTPGEVRRLERALRLARFSEVERISWLACFAVVVFLDIFLMTRRASWVGLVGSVGGFLFLYARLRGFHLAGRVRGDRGLFSPWLSTWEQRTFTALQFRAVLTGRDPLAPRPEHDPRKWDQHSGSYVTDEGSSLVPPA